MKISVIGLGKLGAPLAAVMASKGHSVIGLDANPDYVRSLNDGVAPVQEPRLQELIDASQGRLTATSDYDALIQGSEATFIIVPTPSDKSGRFSNRIVLQVIESLGRALRKKHGYHLVVITSTVMPGSTGGEIRQALEAHSGRKVGADLGLCYNPEFIALGSVVRDMLWPDLLLIGESDARAGAMLESIYRTTTESSPSVQRMNFVNAELSKIAINTFVTTKISYANMLADLCDRLPGADVDTVTNAIGQDSRVGTKYLKGALGYGGPCFPRDNVAVSAMARNLGTRADIAEATDQVNKFQIERLANLVMNVTAPNGRVGILGLSYKPDTAVIEESQAVALAGKLADKGYRVCVFDPLALPDAMKILGDKVQAAASAEACARSVETLVIATAWESFRTLPPEIFRRPAGQVVVVDCWRILDESIYGSIAEIVHLGSGREDWNGRWARRRSETA